MTKRIEPVCKESEPCRMPDSVGSVFLQMLSSFMDRRFQCFLIPMSADVFIFICREFRLVLNPHLIGVGGGGSKATVHFHLPETTDCNALVLIKLYMHRHPGPAPGISSCPFPVVYQAENKSINDDLVHVVTAALPNKSAIEPQIIAFIIRFVDATEMLPFEYRTVTPHWTNVSSVSVRIAFAFLFRAVSHSS